RRKNLYQTFNHKKIKVMKTQFLIPIFCSLVFIGCSESDDKLTSDGYPLVSNAYFEFLKSEDESFSEGEIEFMEMKVSSEGDTLYNEWRSLQIFEDTLWEIQISENSFGPIEVAGYDNNLYEDGDEWVEWRFYKFRYMNNSDLIDEFYIKDSGKYQ